MACACCTVTAGGWCAPPIPSRFSSCGSRREVPSGLRPSARTWKGGYSRRAFARSGAPRPSMARGASRANITGPVTMKRPRRVVFLGIGAVATVLLAGRVLSGLYVDYQWYAGMHATTLWRARMSNLVILTGATALVITVFVFGNLYAVRRSIVSVVFPRRMGNLEIGEEVPARYLTIATVLSSVALGVLLSLPP